VRGYQRQMRPIMK